MKPALFPRIAVIAALLIGAGAPAASAGSLRCAQAEIRNALQTVVTLRRRTELRLLMGAARGVLIVPQYSRGGFVFDGSGGDGVFLRHKPDGSWSDPAFYHVGAIRFGRSGGGTLGPVVFLLMSRKAVARFTGGGRFSLGADTGLRVEGYSPNRLPARADDVIVWYDFTGLRGGGPMRASGLLWDKTRTRAFYGDYSLTPHALIRSGPRTRRGEALQRALPNT